MLVTALVILNFTRASLSRSRHIAYIFLLLGIAIFCNVLILSGFQGLQKGPGSLFYYPLAYIEFMFWIHLNTKRYINLGWRKNWILLMAIPLVNIAITVMLMFYRTKSPSEIGA